MSKEREGLNDFETFNNEPQGRINFSRGRERFLSLVLRYPSDVVKQAAKKFKKLNFDSKKALAITASNTGLVLFSLIDLPMMVEAPDLESHQPTFEYLSQGGIHVAIDVDGLPVNYTTPDGRQIKLDRKTVLEVKKKAISLEESEIIDEVETNEDFSLKPLKPPLDNFSPEHPGILTLPTDALSEEKLENKGVEIIQGKLTQLTIRENAFSKGAPLETFNNTGRHLKIVLADGPLVSRRYLLDPKYDQVRDLVPETNTGEYRRAKIAEFEKKIDNDRQRFKQKAKESDDLFLLEVYNNIVRGYKSSIFLYRQFTEDELLLDMRSATRAGGMYFTPSTPMGETIIFVAAGESPTISQNRIEIFFDSKGICQIEPRGRVAQLAL